MSDKSKIEWTEATWNWLRAVNVETGRRGWFCEKIAPECTNCYAAAFNRYRGNGIDYNSAGREKVKLEVYKLDQPLLWKRPRKIFPCSMTDLFHDMVPDAWLDRYHAIVWLAERHTFQQLTKREGRMVEYYDHPELRHRWAKALMEVAVTFDLGKRPDGKALMARMYEIRGRLMDGTTGLPPNLWIGVTGAERVEALGRIPFQGVRWVSLEPMLRQLAPEELAGLRRLHQVVVGFESGARARPGHVDWVREVRDFCVEHGVAFYFKQWGEWGDGSYPEIPGSKVRRVMVFNDGRFGPFTHEYAAEQERKMGGHAKFQPRVMSRVGKKTAGRELDGRTWDEFPG